MTTEQAYFGYEAELRAEIELLRSKVSQLTKLLDDQFVCPEENYIIANNSPVSYPEYGYIVDSGKSWPTEIERLRSKVSQLTKLLDDQFGVPCEQIRHAQEIEELRSLNTELVAALEEISRGRGAYDTDPLKHASNCIDEMRELARAALAKVKEGK